MDIQEKIWATFIGIIVAFIIIIISYFLFSEKHLNYYYLASNSSGQLCLFSDIENAADNWIEIHNYSYEEAVEMVKKLNATVVK